jgi:hypothetical protein
VCFKNEVGVDGGGLQREWLLLCINHLFAEDMGLFRVVDKQSQSFWINPLSSVYSSAAHLQHFRFAGRLIGKALSEQIMLPLFLSLPLLKHIVGAPLTLGDLEFFDHELHAGLKAAYNNPNITDLSLYFTVSHTYMEPYAPHNMRSIEIDLIENGGEIQVTNDNKNDFIRLQLKYRFFDSIKDQLHQLLTGIYEVVPRELLSIFDYQELELLMCGIPTVDLDDWKLNTEYFGKYHRNHKVIIWFWAILEKFSPEERARTLQFATGSSRTPARGFKSLCSVDSKLQMFSLASVDPQTCMSPRAHTCFNRIDLPTYHTKEQLQQALKFAINMDITGFSIV